jgi:ABC-type bacteriocin/lantibiotic exporter with double-glycine peptidase domain
MKKINKIMEAFWLILASVSLIVVVYIIITKGFLQNLQLLIFPILAGLMFAFRRIFRKRMETNMEAEKNKMK